LIPKRRSERSKPAGDAKLTKPTVGSGSAASCPRGRPAGQGSQNLRPLPVGFGASGVALRIISPRKSSSISGPQRSPPRCSRFEHFDHAFQQITRIWHCHRSTQPGSPTAMVVGYPFADRKAPAHADARADDGVVSAGHGADGGTPADVKRVVRSVSVLRDGRAVFTIRALSGASIAPSSPSSSKAIGSVASKTCVTGPTEPAS
jgi:hypothetical protein